jgi:large subunit ribosomal protein L10
MLTRAQKEAQVAELRDKLARATGVYVADYRGLDVGAANALRRRIRREGRGEYEYRVTKNTILRLACADSRAAAIAGHFQGPTAVALSFADPVGLARILAEFAKEHEVFALKGAVVEGEALDAGGIARLATLPPLDVLRGRIVGLVQAPATQLVRLFAEPGAQIARVLAARGEQVAGS